MKRSPGWWLLHLAAHPIFAPDSANPGATVFRGFFFAGKALCESWLHGPESGGGGTIPTVG